MFSSVLMEDGMVLGDEERCLAQASVAREFRDVYEQLRTHYIGLGVVRADDVLYRGFYEGFDSSGFVYEMRFEITYGMLECSDSFTCRVLTFRYKFV